MASTRVIIIDAKNKRIYEDKASGISDLQKAVGGYIEIAHEFSVGDATDTIYVNEEGLLEMPEHFFEFKGAHQPFAGNGVIQGSDESTGESVDAASDLASIKSKVKFLSLSEVRRKFSSAVIEKAEKFEAKIKNSSDDQISKSIENADSPLFRANTIIGQVIKGLQNKSPGAGPSVKSGTVSTVVKKLRECRDLINEEGHKMTASKKASDPILQKIVDAVKGSNLVDMREDLESIFKKKDIDFSFDPNPHFRIKYKGKTIVLINKKYVDDADMVVGDVAIGFLN